MILENPTSAIGFWVGAGVVSVDGIKIELLIFRIKTEHTKTILENESARFCVLVRPVHFNACIGSYKPNGSLNSISGCWIPDSVATMCDISFDHLKEIMKKFNIQWFSDRGNLHV